MSEKKILNYPYECKDIVLSKASMSIIDLVNQRQVRGSQVNSILRCLKQGEHFDSPFIVNINNGFKRIRVIDGGHRTEALKRYFELFPNTRVKVKMIVYRDLNEAQEREIYTKWNIGVKQSVDDFINSYKDAIPEFENLLTELPVSVYGSKNKLKVRLLVDAYLSSKQVPFVGGLSYGRLDWVDAMRKITYEDIISMKKTFSIVSEIFNPRNVTDFTRLLVFTPAIFKAVYCLVHVNETFLGKTYVVKRMKKVLSNSSVLEKFKSRNRQGVVEAYIYFKQLLNDNVDHKFK